MSTDPNDTPTGAARRGKKWNELPTHTSLKELGFSIQGIKIWRQTEFDAGRSSALADFYLAHGLCPTYHCDGAQIVEWDEEASVSLWEI